MKADYDSLRDKIYFTENGMGEKTRFGYPSPSSDSLNSMQDPEDNITRFVRDGFDRVTVHIPEHEKPPFRHMGSQHSGSWEASFLNADSGTWEAS